MQNKSLFGGNDKTLNAGKESRFSLACKEITKTRKTVSIIAEQSEATVFLREYIDKSSWITLGQWYRIDSANLPEIGGSGADVVLVDAHLPSGRTVQSAYLLKKFRPEVIVIMLADQPNLADLVRYLQAGADGVFGMPGTCGSFEDTVQKAMAGWKPFPHEIGKILAEHLARRFVGSNGAHLTQAEAEVLAGLVDGKRDKDIATDRGTSEGTVHAITNSLYKKVGAHSRTQVVERFLPLGGVLPIVRRLSPTRRPAARPPTT